MNKFYWGRRELPKLSNQIKLYLSTYLKYSSKIFLAIIIALNLMLFSKSVLAQSSTKETVAGSEILPKELHIGERVPSDFWTKEQLYLVNGDTLRMNLSKYKGKMLVLSFWGTWCSSCLKNQEAIEFFTNQFPNDISVIKVNSLHTKDDYSKIQDALNGKIGEYTGVNFHQFSSIIHDLYLEKLFPHHGLPYYVWINKSGVVQMFTFRNLLDKNYLKPYIN